jgi:hypothetical protein
LTRTPIAANDFRSTFGARWYNNVFWAGGCVTGPTAGAIHSASSVNPPGTTEQYGAVAHVAGQVVSGNDYSLHLGADAEFLIKPPDKLTPFLFLISHEILFAYERPLCAKTARSRLRSDPTAATPRSVLRRD